MFEGITRFFACSEFRGYKGTIKQLLNFEEGPK